MNNAYATNRELLAAGYCEVLAPGYELNSNFATDTHTVSFWRGFFLEGRILDRTSSAPAMSRVVATIWKDGDGYRFKTTPGPKAAIRYGYAPTFERAEHLVRLWIHRRFAHVSKGGC